MADDQPTCGKGLAAHAVLPEKLAALLIAMAAVLENHVRALDPDESAGRLERAAYERLVGDQLALAQGLEALGRAMEGYRDLPIAKHDVAALTDETSRARLAAFIQAEGDVLTLMQHRIHEHLAMLNQMSQMSQMS